MGSSPVRPVARRWVLNNHIFDAPESARRFRDGGFPDLATHEGYLGDFLLLDTERATLAGLSLWEDEQAELRSRPYLSEAASTFFGVETAQEIEVSTLEVCFSRFNFGPGGRPVVPERDSVVVSSVVFRGAAMLEPGVQDVLARHATEYLVQQPGCLGVLMLTDPEDAVLDMGTFWTDERSADRVKDLAQEAVRSITSSVQASATPISRLRALVFDPIDLRIR